MAPAGDADTDKDAMTGASMTGRQSQRIDKWLWCARFFKTRTLAGKAVAAGDIRVTRGEDTQRVTKPSFALHPADTLSFSRGQRLFIIEVAALAARRGPAPEARTLYTDHSPPLPPKQAREVPAFEREKGAGRPTKKERRALDHLKEEH